MNIEEQLKRAFGSAEGGERAAAASYAAFEEAYADRVQDRKAARALDHEADAAELGIAAYHLGVHLALHGRLDDAAHWLEIAARGDIGDSAIRLARVYEAQAVRKFNEEPLENGDFEEVDEFFSEAYGWYSRAAALGYGGEDHPSSVKLDSPLLALDCCPPVREMAATEKAEAIVVSAQVEASRLVRQARTDVNVVVDNARQEVEELAARRQALASEVARFGANLMDLTHVAIRARSAIPRLLLLFTAGFFSSRARGTVVQLCAVHLMMLNRQDLVTEAIASGRPSPGRWRKKGRWRTVVRKLMREDGCRDGLPHWARPAAGAKGRRAGREHLQEAVAGHGHRS